MFARNAECWPFEHALKKKKKKKACQIAVHVWTALGKMYLETSMVCA